MTGFHLCGPHKGRGGLRFNPDRLGFVTFGNLLPIDGDTVVGVMNSKRKLVYVDAGYFGGYVGGFQTKLSQINGDDLEFRNMIGGHPLR